MHDPMTLAFEIKYPWWEHKPWPKKHRHDGRHAWEHRMSDAEKADRCSHWPEGYRNSFISIWHVDPERGGSDDSCGWTYPKLTKWQLSRLKNASWSEGRNRHFLRCLGKEWNGNLAEVESLHRGLVLIVARVLRIKMSYDEIALYAIEATHNLDCGKSGSAFCFLPGYHTNFEKDTDERREDHFYGIMCGVARQILRDKRPWWKHPKWHFWHWKFQCHPLQHFQRWAFSRCCKCGSHFKWGESPVTHQWNADGPSWTGEKHAMHQSCSESVHPVKQSELPTN